jgi:DNA polymerase
MMNRYLREYWNILNLTRDYIRDGWMRDYGEPSIEETATGKPSVETASAESPEDAAKRLAAIGSEVVTCTRCRLSETRNHAVPGEGVAAPTVMIIGEAPGGQEDASGRPFVGRAGKYLDKWMEAIGLSRDRDLFIGNIIKCRPPNNRDPYPDEQATCLPYLERQVDLIRPKAILTVGRISTHILTGTTEGIGRLHGRVFPYRGIPLIPTYHPSGVLRNPEYRKPVWEDLKKLKSIIDDGE